MEVKHLKVLSDCDFSQQPEDLIFKGAHNFGVWWESKGEKTLDSLLTSNLD